MAFLSSLNIGASALTAQKTRMDIISQNISNRDTTKTASGEPYRRQVVVFEDKSSNNFGKALMEASAHLKNQDPKLSRLVRKVGEPQGVRISKIADDPSDLTPVYDPEHPDADEKGYIYMPNVDTTKEMVDLIAASRSYQANVTAINSVKEMASKALEIGK